MTRSSLLLLGLIAASEALAQGPATLDAVVETKRFEQPGQGVRLDVAISVIGATAVWKANAHSFQQAQVEALTIVEKDSAIVDYRKSDVGSPERTDTLHTDFLVDEHFLLQPGTYTLSVELTDLQGPEGNRSAWRAPLVIPAPGPDAHLSDILFTGGTRTNENGEQVPAPYPGTYFPSDVDHLAFYAELYGTDKRLGKDSLFSVSYQISTYETKQVKGAYRHVQRAKAAAVVPVSAVIPIADLPSGNYELVVEATDRNGNPLAHQEQFFQRNNPLHYDVMALKNLDVQGTFVASFTDRDTLAEAIASLRPIAEDLERRMIDDRWKDKDMELMKRFFYTFWVNRDGYDPEGAWKKYHEQVIMANKMYGCRNQRGYESDQGITFLRYGLPSTVVDGSNDNKQLPYIIWHYYRAGKYSNKRFVFWQQNTGIGCWELLHSEIPGEVKNYNWQAMLNQPLGFSAPSDGQRVYSTEGLRLDDNFNNPH